MALADDLIFDGRRVRAQRTRASISNALLQLLEEGHHDPPAQQVAKRASVSVRAVFHHFQSMEGLYTAVIDNQTRHIIGLLSVIPTRQPTLSKARRVVAMHDDLYSLAAPLHNCLRFNSAARSWAQIDESLQRLRRATSSQIQQSFLSEISRHHDPHDAARRLQAVMSFEMWDHFRRVQGCSRHATRSHMLALLMTELEA